MISPVSHSRLYPTSGANPTRADARLEPEPRSTFIALGFNLHAGADPGERRRLLVDLNLEADLAQRCGSPQAGDPGADDRYRGRFLRHRVPAAGLLNSP